jgi:hypothetical protein
VIDVVEATLANCGVFMHWCGTRGPMGIPSPFDNDIDNP